MRVAAQCEHFRPIQKVDAFIHPCELSLQMADEIERVAPFGVDNPQPVFACKNIIGEKPKVMGAERNHLSFLVKGGQGRPDIRALAWGMAAYAPLIGNEMIDITFEPERNEFNGNASVQCTVKTISPSKEGLPFPDRLTMRSLYKFFKKRSSDKGCLAYDLCKENALFKASQYANEDERFNSTYTMQRAIEVFEELGLMQFNHSGEQYIMPEATRVFDLNESRTWRLK